MTIDKLKPNDPRVQRLTASVRGKTYSYLLSTPQGPPTATALLIHGFPDLSFGWRNQILMLTSLGLRVIAVDALGYGETDAPQELSSYTAKSMASDMSELIKQICGPDEQVILGGHDWGGALAWRILLWHPEMLKGVFSVCTPFFPCSPVYRDVSSIIPNFGYQRQFRGPDVEREAVSESKIKGLLRGVHAEHLASGHSSLMTPQAGIDLARLDEFADSCKTTSLLDDEEAAYYAAQFLRNGMRGPLNWYRVGEMNQKEELELLAGAEGKSLQEKGKFGVPALMVIATKDPVLAPQMSDGMEAHFESLEKVQVEGSHWALSDRAAEHTNAAIKAFVKGLLADASHESSL